MTKSRTTRRALFTSATAILLCVVMLVGTTFAWFTDTASTNVNRIVAGELKIDLINSENKSVKNGDFTTLNWKTDDNRAQTEIFWEPGATYELESVTIKNLGNLHAKYKIEITGINGDPILNDVIDWTIQVNSADENLSTYVGHLTPKDSDGDSAVLTIKGHMQESAPNAYQGKSIDSISITVLATQDTVEFDSTTDKYDANAAYPVHVKTEEQFKGAFENAKDGDTIVLDNNLSITSTGEYGNGTPDTYILANDVVIDLNQKTLTVNSNDKFMLAGDNITIKNGTIQAGADTKQSSGKISYALGVTAGSKNALIENITIDGGIEVLGNGATATLRNVTSTATNYYNIYLAGGATATIESGTFTSASGKVNFYTQTANDKVIVSGGTFSGSTPTHSGSGTLINNIGG